MEVDAARIDAGTEAAQEPPGALLLRWIASMSSNVLLRELGLARAGDLARARVREQDAAGAVDDHHAVGGALEEVGVALEELRRAARPRRARTCSAPSRRAATSGCAHCAARWRWRWRWSKPATSSASLKRDARLRAQEQHAERAVVVQDRESARARRRRAPVPRWRTTSSSWLSLRVVNHERAARGHDLADLGVLLEIDRAGRAPCRRRSRRARSRRARVGENDDAAAIDARDLGDALARP